MKNSPDITDETVTTKMGIAVTVDVLANDFDADGNTYVLDRLSCWIYGIAKKINHTPNADFVGTDTI